MISQLGMTQISPPTIAPISSFPPPPTLLSDPTLAPFLLPNFSAKTYLNSTLPPLLPPSSLSSATASKSQNPETLSSISSKTTTLLSTLDLQTQRLLITLQALTDEILRLTPRLGYEVDLLRSDVLSLSTALTTDLLPDITHFQSPTSEKTILVTDATQDVTTTIADTKPDVLSKLEMLATVRARLEDVIRIFGEAMAWPLNDPEDVNSETPAAAPEDTYGVLVPARTPSPIRVLESGNYGQKKKATANPIEEILYLFSCDDLPAASKRIQQLKRLATVFEGTIESSARTAVVEALEAKVNEEEKKKASWKQQERRQVIWREEEKRKAEEDAEKVESGGWAGGREGYYGLINQLSRMRGGMA